MVVIGKARCAMEITSSVVLVSTDIKELISSVYFISLGSRVYGDFSQSADCFN